MDTFIDSLVESKSRPVRRSRVLRCTNCGRENGRQRTYCTRCGTILRKAKKAKASSTTGKRRRELPQDYMLLALLLALVAVAYLVYAVRRAPQSPAVDHVVTSRSIPAAESLPVVEPTRSVPSQISMPTESTPVTRRYDPATLFVDVVPGAPRTPRKTPASTAPRSTSAAPLVPPTEPARPAAVEIKAEPPTVVAELPKTTPQQHLQTAIERCASENLSRFFCEQRARFAHCEGHWGQWSQCPGMPATDRIPGG